MGRISDLKKGAFLNINGEMFEVAGVSSTLPSPTSTELEITLELLKIGDKQLTANYKLSYKEKTQELKFEFLDKKEGSWKEQKVIRIGF